MCARHSLTGLPGILEIIARSECPNPIRIESGSGPGGNRNLGTGSFSSGNVHFSLITPAHQRGKRLASLGVFLRMYGTSIAEAKARTLELD